VSFPGRFEQAYAAASEAELLFEKSNSSSHTKLSELYALYAQICLQIRKLKEAESLAKEGMMV
jgi:hypothetical protein